MDGLSPALLDELLAQGELPNFARLRDAGACGPMHTTVPPESPVAWSGIATGCNPGKHGIFDFLHRDPATYRPRLTLYELNRANLQDKRDERYLPVRRAPGFWTFTSDAGLPTTVVRWPAAFPPEPVAGNFLSGLGVPDARGRLGRYTLITSEPDASGNRRSAAWDGDTLKSHIDGPIMAGMAGRQETRADLVVRRLPDARIALTLGEAPEVALAVGQWSGHIPVTFKAGWAKGEAAIVRACLVALDPHLQLYVSTPELDPLAPSFPFTAPDAYAAELAGAVGRFSTVGMPEDVDAMKDGVLSPDAFLHDMLRIFDERRSQFRQELARFHAGLLAVVFDAGDRIQHMFWRTREPDHPFYDPQFAKAYGHVIPDMYRRMDAILGEALAAADDETTVIAVSDHGFGSYRRSVGINSWLVENGLMTLKTPDGRNGRELFADVDWSRTRAYSLGFASLYLNLKGREKLGTVEPGEPARRLAAELAERLRTLEDPETGQPVVRNVHLGSDIYHGDAAPDGPDLVVGLEAGYRAEKTNVIGAAPADVVTDNLSPWAGDHLTDASVVPGVFAANRPLASPQPGRPRNIDVAPSILATLGVDVPPAMDGQPLL